jgi:hypothetical protein
VTTVSTARHSSRLSGALATALPPFLPTFGGALLWGIAMGASAMIGLLAENWETPHKIRAAATVFAIGGFAAFPFALIAARFLSYERSRETAFAAAFLSFAAVTVLAVGCFYALDYRSYYAEWHAEAFTRIWFLQFAHTIAAALYQFAVLGLRLFFPLGFIGLIIASAWFARRAR